MVHIYVDKIKVITREGRILMLSYEEKELEDFIMWQVIVFWYIIIIMIIMIKDIESISYYHTNFVAV